MNFGFTGCHSSVPHLQRLAVYAADALAELEAALLPAAKANPKASRASSGAKAPRGGKAAEGRAARRPRKDHS
jgi:hypothetical protein